METYMKQNVKTKCFMAKELLIKVIIIQEIGSSRGNGKWTDYFPNGDRYESEGEFDKLIGR